VAADAGTSGSASAAASSYRGSAVAADAATSGSASAAASSYGGSAVAADAAADALPDVSLPFVLAVELLPSVADAEKVCLDVFAGTSRNAWLCRYTSS
jgi:hypothetical protein